MDSLSSRMCFPFMESFIGVGLSSTKISNFETEAASSGPMADPIHLPPVGKMTAPWPPAGMIILSPSKSTARMVQAVCESRAMTSESVCRLICFFEPGSATIESEMPRVVRKIRIMALLQRLAGQARIRDLLPRSVSACSFLALLGIDSTGTVRLTSRYLPEFCVLTRFR